MLAVWVGAWSIVPMAGGIIGYAPVVLLAGGEGTGSLLFAIGAGLVWLVADFYLQRWAGDSTDRPGPLMETVALAFGLQLGWLVGILISLFVMALLVALLDQSTQDQSTQEESTQEESTQEESAAATLAPAELLDSAVDRGLRREDVHFDRLDSRSAGTAVAAIVSAFLSVLGNAAPAPTLGRAGADIGHRPPPSG